MSHDGPAHDRSPAPRVVLGVGGGIAAYKACELLRGLTESGHDVRVVPTASALEFVGAPTWAALSGQPVAADVWDDVHEVPHVRIGREADLLIVAPATADLLAKAAHGLADDLLTNTLLTARCPVLMAPAMHTEMWEHPATRANVATLRSRGVHVLDPDSGRLTGADTGRGRLPHPQALLEAARDLLLRGDRGADLAGRHVVVSAGGTRESLDPVRYLGNHSSGRQGQALAVAALSRGARVTLVRAHVDLPAPAGVDVVEVESTADLRDAVVAAAAAHGGADAVVMAAAPADFRPAEVATTKIKKTDDASVPVLELVQTVDVLAQLGARRPREDQVVVGFAAETSGGAESVIDLARAKLRRKGCDLLVLNDVGGGAVFGRPDTTAVVLDADGGEPTPVPPGPKGALAHVVWDRVAARLDGSSAPAH